MSAPRRPVRRARIGAAAEACGSTREKALFQRARKLLGCDADGLDPRYLRRRDAAGVPSRDHSSLGRRDVGQALRSRRGQPSRCCAATRQVAVIGGAGLDVRRNVGAAEPSAYRDGRAPPRRSASSCSTTPRAFSSRIRRSPSCSAGCSPSGSMPPPPISSTSSASSRATAIISAWSARCWRRLIHQQHEEFTSGPEAEADPRL